MNLSKDLSVDKELFSGERSSKENTETNEKPMIKNNIKKLLDIMYIKRFCIPSNIDIKSYNNQYLCSAFNHISCFLYWKFIWFEDG
jgi:hypothetical protein